MKIQFATQSYRSKSLPVSAQRVVNMYAAAQPKDAKNDIALFGAAGIGDFTTCGTGPVRAMHMLGGVLHAVSGGTLYRVDRDGTATAVGSTILGSDLVSVDDNGDQLAIVNGANGYIYSLAAGFQLISDADFNAAGSVTYMDGRFVFDHAGTNEFFISDELDGTSYSDLFASAEWKSDNVVKVLNHLQTLYIMGATTIEPWYSSGAANFPFQRIEQAGVDRGIIGANAAVSEDQALFMIGSDRIAHRIASGQIAPISTDAINEAWQDYARVSDAHMFSFTFDGHRFVVVTFPSVPATFVFDKNTSLWHERVSWDMNGRSLGRWRGNCAIAAYDKILIGDAFSGRIGYLDKNLFTEWGNTIQAELISPPIHADGARAEMPWFELDIESGVGLPSGQGSVPQIMLSISDDGGRTWSDQELWKSMGALGEYKTRLRWDRLGGFEESRLLKVTIADPVRRTIIAARCPGLRAAKI